MVKKIRKPLTAVMFAASALLASGAVFAADSYRTDEIGNVSYSVPENLTAKHSEGQQVSQNLYEAGDSMIIAQFVPGTAEGAEAQKAKVEELASSFSSVPGYAEDTAVSLSFQSLPADMRSFTYMDGADEYSGRIYVAYTGEGVASFMFGCPSDASDLEELTDTFSKLTGSIKTKRITDDQPSAEETAETQQETQAETEPPVQKNFGAGSYKVGDGMQAGEYLLTASNGAGHATVSEDGEKASVKLSKSFPKSTVILAEEGDFVEFSGAEAELAEPGQKTDLTTEGTFEGGIHVVPGTYSIVADEGEGWFCLYADSKQNSIKAEGPVSGETQVTIEDGNCLELSGCRFKEAPQTPEREFTDAGTARKVQEALNAAGYDCGKVDGVVGKKTKDALSKYAQDKGIGSGERITASVLDSLGIAYE